MILKFIIILLFYCYIGGAHGYVRLQSSGPTVLGANITLSATLVDEYPGVEYKFVFLNVEKKETVEILSSETVVNYTVKMSRDKYDVGFYAFEVGLYRKNKNKHRPFSPVDRDRIRVSVTELLNGKLKLIQNGFDRSYGRIFPNERVSHIIELSKEELQFLTDDNTYLVHWYIDCTLISSTGLSFDYTYEEAYKTYNLEALVEVEHNKFSNGTSSSSPEGLSGFKCAQIYSSGYTYGYYKARVRVDTKDGSAPPPRASSKNPSNTWQNSGSSASAIESSPRPWRTTRRSPWRTTRRSPWRTTQRSPWRDERVWNTSPIPTLPEYKPWKNWRTTERSISNTFDSGDHKNCTTNANNALISIKDGHIKIAMDLVFHGTLNVSSLRMEGN